MILRVLMRLFRTFRYYAVDWRRYLGCFFDRKLKMRFGKYELYSGHELPYFFWSESVPLAQIVVGQKRIEETTQFRRVKRVLEHYPDLPPEREIEGRDARRIYELVDARLRGRDNFIVLLQRMGPQHFEKIDGATRLAVLLATGCSTVTAVFTLRGESRF